MELAKLFAVDPARRALLLTQDFGRAEPHRSALCHCCAPPEWSQEAALAPGRSLSCASTNLSSAEQQFLSG